MNRKDFLTKTFQCGIGACLGMTILASNNVFASIIKTENPGSTTTEDGFLLLFSGIKNDLKREITDFFDEGTIEHTILGELKNGWGQKDTIGLLKELKDKYGEKAIDTMSQFVKKGCLPYWTGRGKSDAKKDSEVTDFIHALWGSMGTDFEFKTEMNNGIYKFCVTKCPYAQLAQQTDMHEWVYQMACITDYYMTPAFSKEIGFSRTKTLIQDNENCNHTYYYKREAQKADATLGYCGLYCGGCPNHQNTQALNPIDYSRKRNYESCEGCNSGFAASNCKECVIKDCARSKNIRVCLDCTDYPCSKMTNFINDKRYPYHKKVEGNMKQYKALGLANWIIAQKNEYVCKSCNTKYNYFQTNCSKCGILL